jgi:hypothetical protein
MKIDWKKVALSAGYISLKEAMIHDIQDASKYAQSGYRPMRNKQEFHNKFRWVISRALHYVYHTKNKNPTKALIKLLNEWESKRTYWWLNYYQDCNQPRLDRTSRKRSLASIRKECKKEDKLYSRFHQKVKNRYFDFLLHFQKQNSKRKGKKARYTTEQKIHHKKYGFK